MKPKTNRTPQTNASYDRCKTPANAIPPLVEKLLFGFHDATLWESASGPGWMADNLAQYMPHAKIISTDINDPYTGNLTGRDFFNWQPPEWDIQITNPPYSIKYDWLARSYELGKPFALLMPVEMLGAAKAQHLFQQHGVDVILLSRRINFYMPYKGFTGHGAQFPVAWYTWGIIQHDPWDSDCRLYFANVPLSPKIKTLA